MAIHLYEDNDHQIYLRRDDAAHCHQVVAWRNGDFQQHAERLDIYGTLAEARIAVFDAAALGTPVATWYGRGVFTTEPLRLQPGSAARRYIGPYLVDVARYMNMHMLSGPFLVADRSEEDEDDDLED